MNVLAGTLGPDHGTIEVGGEDRAAGWDVGRAHASGVRLRLPGTFAVPEPDGGRERPGVPSEPQGLGLKRGPDG